MLEMLLGASLEFPDRVSWVDLDEGMRRRLAFLGGHFRFRVDRAGYVISVFYLRWPPVRILVDPL